MQESWRIWGSRGRRDDAMADLFPRDLFNPVRSYHPDEYQVFKSLSNMRPRKLDFDPGNYIYPSLHTYLVGAAEGVASLLGVVQLRGDLGYYFDHPDAMGRMYLVGRALSLLAAAGALLLVWRVGEAMGRGTGLMALVLLAAMPALGIHAHSLTRDTLAAVAAIAFFMACLKVAETGLVCLRVAATQEAHKEAKWFDIAGAAAGLCVALQYFAVVLWLMIPLAAVLRLTRHGGSKRSLAIGLATSFVVMIAVFCFTNPYHVIHVGRFLADFRSETTHMGGGILGRIVSLGWLTHLPKMLPFLATWPLAVVVGLGVLVALVRRRPDDWLLLAWLVLWGGVVGLDGRVYSRYYVPLLPALALVGARGLAGVGELVARVAKARWCGVVVVLVLLAGGVSRAVVVTYGWSRLYALENSRTLAGEWIAKRVPAGARIGVTEPPWQYEMPPLDRDKYRLVAMRGGAEGSPYDLARLMQAQPDYFVTSSIQCGTMPGQGDGRDEASRFWRFLFSGQMYRVAKVFRIEQPFLPADTWRLPEDMRYVNPVIYVLERATAQAAARVPRTKG